MGRGDEATLINLLKSEMAPPKLQAWLEQTLLAERNHNWLKKWSTLPNESFIVVGALHLYGDQGLLALLEQQGWRITRSPSRVRASRPANKAQAGPHRPRQVLIWRALTDPTADLITT